MTDLLTSAAPTRLSDDLVQTVVSRPASVATTTTQTVLHVAGVPFARRVSARPERWREPLLTRAMHLASLGSGWDGGNAIAVQPASVVRALEFLDAVMTDMTPLPLIAPTSRGGIHFEWDLPTGNLEVDVDATGPVDAADEESEWDAGTADGRAKVEALLSLTL